MDQLVKDTASAILLDATLFDSGTDGGVELVKLLPGGYKIKTLAEASLVDDALPHAGTPVDVLNQLGTFFRSHDPKLYAC
jgi:hypothetical protein